MIPLAIPHFEGREWQYLKSCLDDNWVSSAGPQIAAFEKAVAGYVGARHGVATVNGTAALHLALLAAGVKPGDEVLVPTLTFIAPVNAIMFCGARPVFMDSEYSTCNIDSRKTCDFLERECKVEDGVLVNRVTGRRIGAILPVHLFGHPADLDPILDIAERYGVPVVEDASECLGAMYKGRKIGSYGSMAVFSFNGNKVITTGGGGMLVTIHHRPAERARYLSTQARNDPVEYVHDEIGFNYRMPNLNAALGLAQMEQIDSFIEKKRAIALRYAEAFKDVPGIRVVTEMPWAYSSYWLSTVFFEPEFYGLQVDRIAAGLRHQGIEARRLWQPVHWQKPYRGYQTYRIEIATRLYETGLNLPCSVGLIEYEQNTVIRAVRGLAKVGTSKAKAQTGGVV